MAPTLRGSIAIFFICSFLGAVRRGLVVVLVTTARGAAASGAASERDEALFSHRAKECVRAERFPTMRVHGDEKKAL